MRRLLSYNLKGQRTDRVECRGGVLVPDEFPTRTDRSRGLLDLPARVGRGGTAAGDVAPFDSSGRMALGALSYINFEARNRSLLVQAFHTFPDDYAIVKSQSLFQLP